MSGFVALANPVAGRGDAPRRAAGVVRALRDAGAAAADVHVTTGLDDARARVRLALAASPATVVVAAGGDGFVGAVAGAVAGAGGALGIVPAGRGNDFARALGLGEGEGAREAADRLLRVPERRVDLLEAGGRLVAGSVATGIDAAADARVDAARGLRVPAPLAYRLAALGSLVAWRPPVYEVAVDGGGSVSTRGYTVVVANAATYGAGLRVAPAARVDDGELAVVIIAAFPRRRFPRLLAELKTGAHVGWPEVTVLRGRSVTVAARGAPAARADGEPLGALPLTVRVRPGLLRVRGAPHED